MNRLEAQLREIDATVLRSHAKEEQRRANEYQHDAASLHLDWKRKDRAARLAQSRADAIRKELKRRARGTK